MYNWFQIAKKYGMALDPNAWKGEANPHVLPMHQSYDVVPTSQGTIRMPRGPQDQQEMSNMYSGVHFTPSETTAALYACNKATENDPPVLIQAIRGLWKEKMDADAIIDKELMWYLDEKRNEWSGILSSNVDDESKISEIIEDIEHDMMYRHESDGPADPADFILQNNKQPAPSAIGNYLENLDPVQAINAIKQMISGTVPTAIEIAVANQFRVMHPVNHEFIVGVYQIPWYDFSDYAPYNDNLDEETEEDTEEDEGRPKINMEDMGYDNWLNKTPLWVNNQRFLGFTPEETVWHGTSLSRAKQAFPELIGRPVIQP